MSKAQQIEALLAQGLGPAEVARRLGIHASSVSRVKVHGYAGALKYDAELRRRRGGRSRSEQRASTLAKNAPIIAAVDAGMTYAAVAEKFGLKSRNVVAGIVNRRAEGRT